MIKLRLIAAFLVCAVTSWAQEDGPSRALNHCEEHDDHFHANELGLSVAPVLFNLEEEIGWGLHAHFIHRLGQSPFGIGGGAELILDEHRHQTYSFVGQWTPLPALHLVIAPGVAIEKEVENGVEEWEKGWAVHFELVKEFGLGKLDIGPSLEYALDAHGSHYAVGVHLGIPFD